MPLVNYYRRQHVETLLRIAKAVRADAARTHNAEQNSAASPYWLPAELICSICGHLPLAERFCLMMTCVRFWHSRHSIPIFAQVQRQLAYPPSPHLNAKQQLPYRHDIAEIQFHIPRLVEFDKFGSKGSTHLCCWACMRTNRKGCFPKPTQPVNLKLLIQAQRTNPLNASMIRSCQSKDRRMWVGLCYELSFAELRCLQYGMMYCEGGGMAGLRVIDIFPANGGQDALASTGFTSICIQLDPVNAAHWVLVRSGQTLRFPSSGFRRSVSFWREYRSARITG